MDLDTLLESCRQGDDLAWEQLVRRYQGRVYGLAFHYLGNREDAREAAQETFVRVYRGLHSFKGDAFVSWLVSVARNCCIDRLRHTDARPHLGAVPFDEDNGGPDPLPGPEKITMAHERRTILYRALDRMSAINREMILLKEIQGLKQTEIAEVLSLPLGTVKTRSHRARLELARCILELDPEFGA